MSNELLDTLNKGVGLATKMVARGVSEVSKTFRGPKEPQVMLRETGLFFQKHLAASLGSFLPRMEFFEQQAQSKMVFGLLKNLTMPGGERSFAQACQLLVQGNRDGAFQRLLEAVSSDTQLTDGYFLLGCMYLDMGSNAAAVENFNKAMLLQQGLDKHMKKYIPSFRMTLPLTENSSFAFFADLSGLNILLALALRAQGQMNEALQKQEQLLGVMPGQPLINFFISCLYFEVGGYQRIVEKLASIAVDSNINFANMLLLARSCRALGDLLTAKDLLRKHLNREDLDPDLLLDARYSLGMCLAQEGRSSEAKAETDRVLLKKRNYMDLFDRLGLTTGAAPQVVSIPVPQSAPGEAAPAHVPGPSPDLLVPPSIEVSPGMPTRLVSEDGKFDLELKLGTMIIGRETGDVILATDSAASKQHARITVGENAIWVEDLGSTNGTWVNQHRIGKKVMLNKADLLVIGQTRFRPI